MPLLALRRIDDKVWLVQSITTSMHVQLVIPLQKLAYHQPVVAQLNS